MTKKNKFEKGNSSLSNKKLKKVTSKRNSWKHQMYELEIAIAKESSIGNMFPSGLGDFGLFYLE